MRKRSSKKQAKSERELGPGHQAWARSGGVRRGGEPSRSRAEKRGGGGDRDELSVGWRKTKDATKEKRTKGGSCWEGAWEDQGSKGYPH